MQRLLIIELFSYRHINEYVRNVCNEASKISAVHICVTEYNKLLTKMSDKKMGPPFSYILCALTSSKTNNQKP